MIQNILILFLCCFAYTLAQGTVDKCELGHPPNISANAPKKCCNIKQIYDKATEAKCLEKFQDKISNVNTGVKGKFDGLECFFACLFNGTGALKNNMIDVPALKRYAAGVLNDNTWVPVVNSAIDFCYSQVLANEANINLSMGNKTIDNVTQCSVVPSVMGICILSKQIVNCPESAKPKQTGNSNECQQLKKYNDDCPIVRLHGPKDRPASAPPRG